MKTIVAALVALASAALAPFSANATLVFPDSDNCCIYAGGSGGGWEKWGTVSSIDGSTSASLIEIDTQVSVPAYQMSA